MSAAPSAFVPLNHFRNQVIKFPQFLFFLLFWAFLYFGLNLHALDFLASWNWFCRAAVWVLRCRTPWRCGTLCLSSIYSVTESPDCASLQTSLGRAVLTSLCSLPSTQSACQFQCPPASTLPALCTGQVPPGSVHSACLCAVLKCNKVPRESPTRLQSLFTSGLWLWLGTKSAAAQCCFWGSFSWFPNL